MDLFGYRNQVVGRHLFPTTRVTWRHFPSTEYLQFCIEGCPNLNPNPNPDPILYPNPNPDFYYILILLTSVPHNQAFNDAVSFWWSGTSESPGSCDIASSTDYCASSWNKWSSDQHCLLLHFQICIMTPPPQCMQTAPFHSLPNIRQSLSTCVTC